MFVIIYIHYFFIGTMNQLSRQCQHILLADDDKDDCLFFKVALDELHINVQLTTVHDGEKLILLLNKDEPLPDILFLDLNMPRKNGLECMSEIKETPRLKNLPVVIYSTSFQKDIVELLYEKGAHFYICKPNGFSELVHLIQEAVTISAQLNYKQPSKEQFVLSYPIP